MTPADVARVALGPIAALGFVWFYTHCFRPAVAMAAGNERAFAVGAITCGLVGLSACVVSGLELADSATGGTRSLRLPLDLLGLASGLVAVATFLAPSWLVRLTGGRDERTPARLVLGWLRDQWTSAGGDQAEELSVARGALQELAALPVTPDPASASCIEALGDYVAARDGGRTTMERRRAAVAALLEEVEPCDPVGRILRRTRQSGRSARAGDIPGH